MAQAGGNHPHQVAHLSITSASNGVTSYLRQYLAGMFHSVRVRIHNSIIPHLAGFSLGLAAMLQCSDYLGIPSWFLAPQQMLVTIARDVMQSDGADCSRSYKRRCVSDQDAEQDSQFAPLEQAVRKVIRHAGL